MNPLFLLPLLMLPARQDNGGDEDVPPAASAPAARTPADARINVADQAYRQRDYPRAERELRAALDLAPERADIHIRLGIVLYRLRRYGDSIEAYRKGLDLAPPDLQKSALGNAQSVGHCFAALGKFQEAADWYRKVVEANPRNRRALWGLGNALEKLGDLDPAEEALRKALALDPDFPPCILGLGRVLMRKGQPWSALPYMELARRKDPFEPDVEFELAKCYRLLGELDKSHAAVDRQRFLADHRAAIDTLRNRLLVEPFDVATLVALGARFDALGDSESARDVWDRALRLSRLDGRVRASRALSLLANGSGAAAEASLVEWLNGQSNDIACWEALWFVRKQLGNTEGANEVAVIFRKISGRDPAPPSSSPSSSETPASAPAGSKGG